MSALFYLIFSARIEEKHDVSKISNFKKIMHGQKLGPVEFACITSFVGLQGNRGNLHLVFLDMSSLFDASEIYIYIYIRRWILV